MIEVLAKDEVKTSHQESNNLQTNDKSEHSNGIFPESPPPLKESTKRKQGGGDEGIRTQHPTNPIPSANLWTIPPLITQVFSLLQYSHFTIKRKLYSPP